jgi:hypothetical protein
MSTDVFKLPIYYNSDIKKVSENILVDLEFVKMNQINKENNSYVPLYYALFSMNEADSNKIHQETIQKFSEYYTTDISFLKEMQNIVRIYQQNISTEKIKYNEFNDFWEIVKCKQGFHEKYYYVDFPMFNFLNFSEHFLSFSSFYNLCSPILMLLVPLIILFIPFLILSANKESINYTNYSSTLKHTAKYHPVGKLFAVDWSTQNPSQIIYIFISLLFYIFSVYQNTTICYRFYDNRNKIVYYFRVLKNYLETTIPRIKYYLEQTTSFSNQANILFHRKTTEKLTILTEMLDKIISFSPFTNPIKFLNEIGKSLKYFYELHTNAIYEETILYSLGFNAYIDCLEGLSRNINSKQINYCKYSKKKTVLVNNYYGALTYTTPIKQTITLDKNMIFTGPNASGKTTILKSLLSNILLAQQFGCGFYDKANICVFDYFHCYLNIPDTSGRDSLFQAEARRCKEMINAINTSKHSRHLCILDELFSGTNPEEAELAAVEFLRYIMKFNVKTMLTTHFIGICKELTQDTRVQNYLMEVIIDKEQFIYTYQFKKGISHIKGVCSVLKDLDYPAEIVDKFRG